MYDCEPEEYATAWTMPLWPVSLAMGLVGNADMFAAFAKFGALQGIMKLKATTRRVETRSLRVEACEVEVDATSTSCSEGGAMTLGHFFEGSYST